MRYKNIRATLISIIIGTSAMLCIAYVGITAAKYSLCVAACINELLLLYLLYNRLAHKKYGRLVINTSNPKKDIYSIQLDELCEISNKDEIILEVYVDDKCSSQ